MKKLLVCLLALLLAFSAAALAEEELEDVTVILDRAAASHLPTHIEGTKIIHKNNGKNTTFSS